MDKIYSRKRLYLPNVTNSERFINKKFRKIIAIIIFLIIILGSMLISTEAIGKVLESVCRDKANSKAVIISNEKAIEVMKKYEYEDIMTIHRDADNNIQMISADIKTINKIISDVALEIQKEINKQEEDTVSLKLGMLTGTTLFASVGPTIPVKISTVGSVKTSYTSEFVESGVNQTLHRVYLNVKTTISIVTPYNTIEEPVETQIIIMENVLVGKVPQSYYNFKGMEQGNALDVVE